MSAFTWTPDFGASKNKKPRVSSIKFGDGYEQRGAFGINVSPGVWSLKFSVRNQTEGQAIDAFLDSMNGVTPFDWTPPGEPVAIKVICREWNVASVKYNLYDISATFEQVYDP